MLEDLARHGDVTQLLSKIVALGELGPSLMLVCGMEIVSGRLNSLNCRIFPWPMLYSCRTFIPFSQYEMLLTKLTPSHFNSSNIGTKGVSQSLTFTP